MVGERHVNPAKRELDVRHQQGGPFVQAVDATGMAMIVTDCQEPGNPIIFANDAFLALSGYRRDEVIGRNYRLLYGPHTDPETARMVEEALAAKGDIALESLLYRKGGQGIWVIHHVSVQRENGELKRHFASFFNIDRRVRAEKEVRRAHQLLEKRVERRTRDLNRMLEEVRRENAKRNATEDVLRHTLDDKDTLIRQREQLVREVNHRVKNTLQMATALLTVQAGVTDQQAVTDGLHSAIGRLERLAEVHRLLYEAAEVALGVHLDTHLNELCHHLLAAIDGLSQAPVIFVDVDEGWWTADEAIPIALIVNEAVTNSLKHAFPNGRGGAIRVTLHQTDGDYYELVAADDGIGGEAPQRPGSLGMKLIETFARQLGGSLSIDREAGTCIKVRFLHRELDQPLAE